MLQGYSLRYKNGKLRTLQYYVNDVPTGLPTHYEFVENMSLKNDQDQLGNTRILIKFTG